MTAKSLTLVSALLFLGLAPLGSAPARAGSGEIRVDTLPRAIDSRPVVAVFPDGGFVVVWTTSLARGRFSEIHARFFDRDGNPGTEEFRLLDPAAGSQVANSIAADPDGSFLLAWTEIYPGNFLGNVFVRRFNRDGTARGGRIQLNRPGVEGHDAVLAIGPDRRLGVAWRSFSAAGQPSPFIAIARTFNVDGAPLSGENRFVGQNSFHPQGAAFSRDGTLLVLSESMNSTTFLQQIWLARVPAGSVSPSLVRVGEFARGTGAGLARLQNGSFIATWYGFELLARRLSPAGAPRGGSFKLTEAFDVVLPKIAPLANGGYVIVWSENFRDDDGDDGGSGYGFFGQAFAADGTPLSAALQINVRAVGHEYGTGVATWRGGPVVAVWQAQNEGTVFARVLPIPNP